MLTLNQEAEATHSLAPTRAELCNVRVSTKVEMLLHRLETPKRLELPLRPRRFEASMSMRASAGRAELCKAILAWSAVRPSQRHLGG